MEHIFELEGFTQEMDGCTGSSCGNNCKDRCTATCRGGCADRCTAACGGVM